MAENGALTNAQLKTPKAAAIAGIIFSLLLFTIFWLLRRSIPADALEPGAWLATDTGTISVALNLIPFAGVAFLWFIGVLRDRLGRTGGPLFCHRVFRQRLAVPGDAVRRRGANRLGHVGGFYFRAWRTDQLSRLSLRARCRLHHRQRVRGENGRRVHVFNVDGCDLYQHRSTLDRLCGIPAGTDCSDWRPIYRLEFRRIAGLGAYDQRIHPDGQLRPLREASVKTVDIIYRYEAGDAPKRRPPPDSNAAVLRLDDGNRDFAALLDHVKGTSGVVEQIIPVDARDLGLVSSSAAIPKQRPFAAVLGCSDARVPIELIFNEGPNDLFVIRVAGNGLGTEVLGSLKYAVDHLGGTLKLVVVLGHSGCGALTAAVDMFLSPDNYLTLATKHSLRSILDRALLVVQASANKLLSTFGLMLGAIRDTGKH